MVEAFLPHTPQIAFADGIGSRCMIRRFQYLDATRFRHTSKARPEFAIVIPNEILWCLPIRSRLSQRYARPKNRSASGSRPRGSAFRSFRSTLKNACERSKEQIG